MIVELPVGIESDEALLLLSMNSLGFAAQMAGYTKRTYVESLSKRGIPVVDYPAEELDRELEILEQNTRSAGPAAGRLTGGDE